MNINQRAQLLELIDLRHSVSVNEVSDICNWSVPTSRKYLKLLQDENLITFKRGIAQKKVHYFESLLGWQLESFPQEKKDISKKAATFIEDGDTVFLGGGSTVLGVLDNISDKQGVTIVTNSVHVIVKAVHMKHIQLICIGGAWQDINSSFDGFHGKQFEEFFPDKSFIGAMGIDVHRGATQKNALHNSIEFSILENSGQGFILADHSKFGMTYPWVGVPINKITNIITNKLTDLTLDPIWKKRNISIISAE